jgi:hypothetical protein
MDYYPRRLNRAKLFLTLATLLIPAMPLLPYVKSGVPQPHEGVVAASTTAANQAAPIAPRAERDS